MCSNGIGRLQWGRGSLAAETTPWSTTAYDVDTLQWDRGSLATETARVIQVDGDMYVLQLGHNS